MFNNDWMRTRRGLLPLPLVLLALGLLMAGCNADDINSLPEAQIGPLVVRKASGGSKNLTGTKWLEPCYDRAPSPPPSDWAQAFMTMGTLGKRTETSYTDGTCLTPTGSVSFDFNVTADGTMPNVTWVDNTGLPASTPPGHAPAYSVTMVTISGDDGASSFKFKTLLFYDDLVAPHRLIFGDDESGLSPLVGGYPTTMFVGGAIRQ